MVASSAGGAVLVHAAAPAPNGVNGEPTRTACLHDLLPWRRRPALIFRRSGSDIPASPARKAAIGIRAPDLTYSIGVTWPIGAQGGTQGTAP